MLPIVLLGLTAVASAWAAARPPNFVFFLTDDQPYLGMSGTGNPVLKTPEMDKLAAAGARFENANVAPGADFR